MTLEKKNEGKVIYARKAEIGKHYTTEKGTIILKFLGMRKTWQKLHAVFLSTETENEIDFKPETLFREITQEEVREMVEKRKKEGNDKPRKERKLKALLPFDRIRPYMQSGKPIKTKDIADKIASKLDKSPHTPYARVGASLRGFVRKGLVKKVSKATFQLVKAG